MSEDKSLRFIDNVKGKKCPLRSGVISAGQESFYICNGKDENCALYNKVTLAKYVINDKGKQELDLKTGKPVIDYCEVGDCVFMLQMNELSQANQQLTMNATLLQQLLIALSANQPQNLFKIKK